MKIKLLTYLSLTFIVLLALFLYFYKVDTIPNGIYSDEATVGYNAYSILKTGKDEFGKSFPVAFRFFGAYTPPLYVYLIIPIIKTFGLTAISLRALSGLSTIICIFLVFYLAKSLKLFQSQATPFLTALVFATSPWVVFNARLGYEVTFGYVLFTLGVTLIWKGLVHKYISYAGLIFLSLSTYVAHTERFLVPIFLLSFLLLFRKELLVLLDKKHLVISLVILVLTQLPNFYLMTTNAFWVKNSVHSGVKISQILIDTSSQFLSYLSPSQLFGASRDINLQHTIPALPLFYSWLIIPFFIGLYSLYLNIKTKGGKFLGLLLLVYPIPGSLSGHFTSIQRVLPLIIPLVLVISLGLDALIKSVNPKRFIVILIPLFLFSFLLLWRSYFIFLPQERAVWWSYGYSQLVEITSQNPATTYVLDNSRLSPAYMSILYHSQYSPMEFQKHFSPEFVNDYYRNPPYNPNYKIGNVDLRPISWETDTITAQVLVGDSLSISDDQAKEHFLEKVFDIKDSLGNSILVGYKTNPIKKALDNQRKTTQKLK